MDDLRELDDQTLMTLIRATLGNERRLLARFLRYLAEVDERRLYAPQGFPSLFAFCTGALGLREAEAYSRIAVARLGRQTPLAIERLESGLVCLTALRMLAPHLTSENAEKLLANAAGMTTRELDRLIVTMASAPKETGRAPPDAAALSTPRRPPEPNPRHQGETRSLFTDPAPQQPAPLPPSKPDRIRYVSPSAVEVRFTADEALLAQLDRIKSLLVNKGVGTKLEEIFGHVFTQYLDRHDPACRAAKKETRPPRPRAKQADARVDRYVPQWIKDAVYRRDGGRCTFETKEHCRCPATAGLEYDHIVPVAKGGVALSPDQVRLRCRSHNRLAAEQVFGEAHIAACIAATQTASELAARRVRQDISPDPPTSRRATELAARRVRQGISVELSTLLAAPQAAQLAAERVCLDNPPTLRRPAEALSEFHAAAKRPVQLTLTFAAEA